MFTRFEEQRAKPRAGMELTPAAQREFLAQKRILVGASYARWAGRTVGRHIRDGMLQPNLLTQKHWFQLATSEEQLDDLFLHYAVQLEHLNVAKLATWKWLRTWQR